jgi:lysophospholipase L1-like esterase
VVHLSRKLARPILALLALVFSLLAAESLLRLLARDEGGDGPQPADTFLVCERDSALGWVFPADTTGVFASGASPTPVVTNEMGLRTRGIVDRPGVHRLLVLGDSYAFGWGVPETDCFPRRLETRLGERLPEQNVEVINAAIPGYSVYQQVRMLDQVRRQAQVHAVIATFSLANDMVDELRIRRYAPDRLRDYSNEVRDPASGLARLVRASRLLSILDERLQGVQLGLANTNDQAQSLAAESLRELVATCRRDRIPLLLVVVPRAQEIRGSRGVRRLLDPAARRAHQRLLALADELQVPVLDLEACLAAAHRSAPVFLPADVHWTAAGHRAVADAILPALLSIWPAADSFE